MISSRIAGSSMVAGIRYSSPVPVVRVKLAPPGCPATITARTSVSIRITTAV